MFGIRADTDTFSKNDVSFNLYYGVHDIGHDSKYDSDPKKVIKKRGTKQFSSVCISVTKSIVLTL